MKGTWKPVAYFSGLILSLAVIYTSFYLGALKPGGFLGAIAATGGVMIGLSLFMTPVSHWILSARRFVKYRKALGIIGYAYAMVYTCAELAVFPERYFDDFPSRLLSPENLLGIIALTGLTLMTLLSNGKAIRLLGFRRWKQVMRIGYPAFTLLAVRAMMLEGETWLGWITAPDGLPPPRLILSIFAMTVIATRLKVIGSYDPERAARPPVDQPA